MSTTIESLELEITSNSQGAKRGINALVKSLDKLRSATSDGAGLSNVNTQLSDINKALSPASTTMKKFSDSLKSASSSANKLNESNNKSAKSALNLGVKLTAAFLAIKKGIKLIGSAITESTEYIENVNLFSVSMGEYASEAKEYAEIVSDAMGIDSSDWMRAQGVFMTMATGFGVAGDRAATMSKNLTQLGYDISSFYNISTEDAMAKLQSGLAGELEPLRRIGYDLSQAKLEATALALGIDKSVSSMTQAEKAQLRYYAIMTQVTTAQGDMARTLDDPANQMRVFKAQVNMAAREIGNIFIPALNAILPYAIAVTKVIRSLANTIAGLFGYEAPELSDSTGKVVENTDAVQENLQGAQEEAKKLKSYMMGFDELNVINPNTDTTEDTSGGFDFELPEYDFLSGLVESKVNTIVEEMKEWLGITDDIDTWAELFDTRLGDILETVGLIGAGFLVWKVSKGFLNILSMVSALVASPTHSVVLALVVTLTGITLSINGIKDAIKNGLDGFNFGEIVAGALLTTAGATLLSKKIVTWIGKIASTKVVFAMARLGMKLGIHSTAALGVALGASITAIIAGIPMLITGIYDAIKNGMDWLNGLLVAAGAALTGAGIGFLIGGPVGAAIGAVIGLVVGLITDLVILIVQEWDKIAAWFKGLGTWFKDNVTQPIGDFFKGLWEAVSGFFKNLWDDIVAIWSTVTTWFDEKVIQPIAEFFKSLWEGIVAIWNTVATWFDTYVITPVVEFFRGLWESVSGFFAGLWDGIKLVWTTVATWFNDNVIQPLVNFFAPIVEWISTFFYGCWLIIQAVWVVASTWFNENVIIPVVEFFKGLWESVSGFFVSLWEGIVLVWNVVATWFDEYVVQPVVGFFRGLWETVAGFFSSLWEGIVLVWTSVSTWFNETVIVPVVDYFKGLWESVAGFFKSLWDDLKLVWEKAPEWFNNTIVIPVVDFFKGVWTSVSGFFSSLWEDIKAVWEKVSTWFSDTIIDPLKTVFEKACEAIGKFFTNLWKGISQGVANAMNGVIGSVESVINWLIGGINNLVGGFDKLVQWAAKVLGKDWGGISLLQEVHFNRITVPTYADGGFPAMGQMFIANEAGPELVGNIGRRTAVANNEQIVESISVGVAEANSEQNALLREQNALLRALLDKDSGVYLDGRVLSESVDKHKREQGRVLITGGAL